MIRGWLWLALLVSLGAHAGPARQAEAVWALRDGKLAIDIRDVNQYETGTLLNAVRVEPRNINQIRNVIVDKTTAFVIFSDTESNASRFEEQLMKRGYYSVINGGTYSELNDAYYDVTDDPAQ